MGQNRGRVSVGVWGAISSVESTCVSEREMDHYRWLCVQGQVDHKRGAQRSKEELIMS